MYLDHGLGIGTVCTCVSYYVCVYVCVILVFRTRLYFIIRFVGKSRLGCSLHCAVAKYILVCVYLGGCQEKSFVLPARTCDTTGMLYYLDPSNSTVRPPFHCHHQHSYSSLIIINWILAPVAGFRFADSSSNTADDTS